MTAIQILLFYKFTPIQNPQQFMKEHHAFCSSLGVLGKVLIGKEGINGSISGTKEQVESYKEHLRADPRFADIVFKEEQGLMHPFRKMIVRVKREIIRMDKEVDMSKAGAYIEPEQFLHQDQDTVILDTRNDYEWKVGKFKNAVTLPIKTFREFPQAVEKLEHLKNKKIVIYCTGGIRCEKASAYMIQQGFTDVSQLHGGIITFCQEKPNTLWEGSCFVFDNRLISNVGNDSAPITSCASCGSSCDLYCNCRNVSCDNYVTLCPSCDSILQGCCSAACFEDYKKTWHN